jgi:hypothetical protein
MAVSESQLEIWSHQGSVTQSANTYNTIRNVLSAYTTPYTNRDYKVFLQGSYGNDTNIYAESDVDVVIQSNEVFHHDLSELSVNQQSAFKQHFSDATYTYTDFKRDVTKVLVDAYGSDVKVGDKAINIASSGNRRKADVIAAVQYRRYWKFNGQYDQSYDEGICFWTNAGQQIANYPRQHSANLTTKHQNTSNWLKPMVRIFKNMRSRMTADGLIKGGLAPSYYLEGLLYNVPNDKFGSSYEDSFVSAANFIQEADRSKFLCANEQYYLLREGSPMTWRDADCSAFMAAIIKFWNDWGK